MVRKRFWPVPVVGAIANVIFGLTQHQNGWGLGVYAVVGAIVAPLLLGFLLLLLALVKIAGVQSGALLDWLLRVLYKERDSEHHPDA